MIQFPETAIIEWQIVADAANATLELRARIQRETLVEAEVERMRVRHQAGLAFQNELDADNTPALEMMTLNNFQINPALAPTDLIEGVMRDNGLTIMMGPSGSGKSTLALQMNHCLMSGDDFLGQPVQAVAGAVGILSYDMDAALTLDWMSGFPAIDPNRVSVVNAYKRGNPLAVPSMRAQIVAAWKAMNVEVVTVDSFSASFFGQDQNDQAATMAHYRDLLRFALTEVGARSLVVISHSTEGSPYKIRGSTVHHDVADSIMAVVEDKKTNSREVRMVKYRQHRTATGMMSHQMNPVVIGAPDAVTHLVDLDLGGMTLAGHSLPVSSVFPDVPEPLMDPDTDTTDFTDSEGDDDL